MNNAAIKQLVDRLCDTDASVVYFPVRHHSPASAMLVGQLIESLQPAAVLIEGPFDFNQHFDELLLEHELPIAIYSYYRVQTSAGPSGEGQEVHYGAYYPFCDYSPEWVALREGRRTGAVVDFIDLPWSEVATADRATHRYADAELRRGRYVEMLCRKLQVEDFDDLWDRIVESHPQLELSDYLERTHSLCLNIRAWEDEVSQADRLREAFMAKQISETCDRVNGRVLVVTGGFHSGALVGRLEGFECPGIDDFNSEEPIQQDITDSGIALTTYSYSRLDSLTGYNAGMPSPGFHEHAWQQRTTGAHFEHQPLLAKLVDSLRDRNQILSTADLIAVETSARALAALRGRAHVWRSDLMDAVTSSLIKDELEYDCESPFVNAVHDVLRGDKHGQLAEGTRVPPLFDEIRERLKTLELVPQRKTREVELNLLEADDLEKSRVLHQLAVLNISGFRRAAGTDFLSRDNLEELAETWRIRWSVEFEATCIEASRYGTSLRSAVTARLLEETQGRNRNAEVAAELLVKAAQTGIDSLSQSLLTSLEKMISGEPQFVRASTALGHLMFLFCFDEAFGTTRLPRLARVIQEAFSRSLWLMELLGQTAPGDGTLLKGMRNILQVWQRVGDVIDVSEEEFGAVLSRVQADGHKPPHVRGAAAGMLWTIGKSDSDAVLADLMYFADPDHLGDFLTGLFAVAREVAQRQPQLVRTIDDLLLQFGADDFQTALPSMRLAFTSFTPREKHHMLLTLFESLGLKDVRPKTLPAVDESTAAEALRIEERLIEAIHKYGLEAPHGET